MVSCKYAYTLVTECIRRSCWFSAPSGISSQCVGYSCHFATICQWLNNKTSAWTYYINIHIRSNSSHNLHISVFAVEISELVTIKSSAHSLHFNSTSVWTPNESVPLCLLRCLLGYVSGIGVGAHECVDKLRFGGYRWVKCSTHLNSLRVVLRRCEECLCKLPLYELSFLSVSFATESGRFWALVFRYGIGTKINVYVYTI